eukprot:CAMPEP_0198254002 /NCGR_PEP_ID=MMETSP1447-20131203/4385_1 /TAXON_ID=420782 /ORGANISM="Chaetoceros dichaeta, Strain CCMP1751" /LENGTH=171 /DNA_ID=CAMNT_0043939903 /DNA_START=37 /DNA_END=552 /DNA_ORIENTATION=-
MARTRRQTKSTTVPMSSSTSGNKVGKKAKKGKRGALRDIMNEERSNTSSSNPASESTTKSNRGAKRKTVAEEPPERSMISDKDSSKKLQGRRVKKGRVAASVVPKNYEELPNSDAEEESCNNDSDYENHGGVIVRETIIIKKTLEFSSRPPDTMYINSMGGDWRTHGAIDY